jgi:hypothetical protein
MSSGNWLAVIVVASFAVPVAAAVAAISNIQYQRARDEEKAEETRRTEAAKAQALSRELRDVLVPEVTGNLALLETVNGQLNNGDLPFSRFQTSAWQTVSAGELVRSFRGGDLAKIARTYEIVHRANDLLDQLTEFSVGVASATGRAKQTREAYTKNLLDLLGHLRIMLKEVQTLTQN